MNEERPPSAAGEFVRFGFAAVVLVALMAAVAASKVRDWTVRKLA